MQSQPSSEPNLQDAGMGPEYEPSATEEVENDIIREESLPKDEE